MHDVVAIEYFESLQNLSEYDECFFLGEVALPSDVVEEGASIAVLVDKIVVVFGLKAVLVLDDMFGGCDAGECVDLVDGALF